MTFDHIRATVRPWSERPTQLRSAPPGCAILVCNSAGTTHELFVNDEISCDHRHLTHDANALIDTYDQGRRDDGWGALNSGAHYTIILTRQAATQLGTTYAEIDS
ncbi:hypothetical protein BJF87_12370 [Gordonia sp. CNJ-863]|uniref:hypothetical protein n=1 Tax=unclassified Gordonia (in: high G+C Gram-positive bacteria) TaxID=2657482 RepID=UPI0009630652|nr:hypothetical protein [Gordonia sp. CNJ-863]OLT52876.1 hypothetical protein BJF87_12370 [Gordonia sp. CNJ-863]